MPQVELVGHLGGPAYSRSLSARLAASRHDADRIHPSHRWRGDWSYIGNRSCACRMGGALHRRAGTGSQFERFALAGVLCLCAPLAILSRQLAMGMPPIFKSADPFGGPVLVAIDSFTSILVVAVIGDAWVVLAGPLSGVPRISRHLWRLCLGLALAAVSGFTKGFARRLPGPYHVPPAFFLPQFLPSGLPAFRMIRVRSRRMLAGPSPLACRTPALP
jgi:hypothetical protein